MTITVRKRITTAAILVSLVISGMLPTDALCKTNYQGKTPVFVSILPQVYFVKRIGGDSVSVNVLVGPGQSPATYEPTPKQMTKLAQSKIYFTIGVPFEKQLLSRIKAVTKDLKIVDTRKDIAIGATATPKSPQEAGNQDIYHDHGNTDPHTWLDPKLVKIQANTICDGLTEIDPDRKEYYSANLKAFLDDLNRVDARIAKQLAPYRGRSFYVFHPAFGYFGKAYGLKQVAVETGGSKPSAKQLALLIEHAKSEGVKVIFVQEQFSTKSAEAIAEAVGGTVVKLDPLAEDYLVNLEKIGEALTTVMGNSGADSAKKISGNYDLIAAPDSNGDKREQ